MSSPVHIGYARTSTTDQKAGLEAQLRDLKAAGCKKIVHEELSSVAATRPQLDATLEWVREGDILLVTKLDRLARSVADMVAITAALKKKGVALRILAMNLDTSTPTSKLMMNLLGSIAEFERELMLERQREGIAKASRRQRLTANTRVVNPPLAGRLRTCFGSGRRGSPRTISRRRSA